MLRYIEISVDTSYPEFLISRCREIKNSLSFVIARRGEKHVTKFKASFGENNRRSNLPSLSN